MTKDHHFRLAASDWMVLRFGLRAMEYGQSINLHSGTDIALHLTVDLQGNLIMNRTRNGAWQQETRIRLPFLPNAPLTLALQFSAEGLALHIPNSPGFHAPTAWHDLLDRPLRLVAGDLIAHQHFPHPARPEFPPPQVEGVALFPDNLLLVHGRHWPSWTAGDQLELQIEMPGGPVTLLGETIWYERAEDGEGNLGFILGCPLPVVPSPTAGLPLTITITGALWQERILLPPSADWQSVEAMQQTLYERLVQNPHGGGGELTRLLTRPIYTGIDSLASLSRPCHFEVDLLRILPGHGLMLAGWLMDPTESVTGIRIGSAGEMVPMDTDLVLLDRPDVQQAFADRYQVKDARCGFLALCRFDVAPGTGLHAEITLKSGEVGFKPLPASEVASFGTIRDLLGRLPLQGEQVAPAFDRILGDALIAIHQRRLEKHATVELIRFGSTLKNPRCSIIVPLYGRLDFIEYQCALLSRSHPFRDDLIFVLDEPERTAEVTDILQSCHDRFGIDLLLVLPEENRGFGPASNLGLQHAKGEYICFLNSDVFPQDEDWLDVLTAGLASDPQTGVIGGACFFADGSIQHIGMIYEANPEVAGWLFPRHHRKGLRPEAGLPRLTRWPAITGACMVMRRELADSLGGFDPDYVIGDFEDADLCNRVRARGLGCAVAPAVRLYHLERQSQGQDAPLWRWNLTLLNAWTFNRRWKPKPPVTDRMNQQASEKNPSN